MCIRDRQNADGGGVNLKDDFQHLIHGHNDEVLDEEVSVLVLEDTGNLPDLSDLSD